MRAHLVIISALLISSTTFAKPCVKPGGGGLMPVSQNADIAWFCGTGFKETMFFRMTVSYGGKSISVDTNSVSPEKSDDVRRSLNGRAARGGLTDADRAIVENEIEPALEKSDFASAQAALEKLVFSPYK